MQGESEAGAPFHWNAEEVLKLLGRGFRVVLFQTGPPNMPSVTAVAVQPEQTCEEAVEEWEDDDPFAHFDFPADMSEEERQAEVQRNTLRGPTGRTAQGSSVAKALHVLTEKVVFRRIPDGNGGYIEPPPELQAGG